MAGTATRKKLRSGSGRNSPSKISNLPRAQDSTFEDDFAATDLENPQFHHQVPLSAVIIDFETAKTPRSDNAMAIAAEAKGPEELIASIKKLKGGPGVIHSFNPYDLDFNPHNRRKFDSDRRRAVLANMMGSIKSNGVREPMVAKVENGRIVITSGTTRLLGTLNAIELLDANIMAVPVRFEAHHRNDEDHKLSEFTNNAHDPYTLLENAEVCHDLIEMGWTVEKLAQKINKTPNYVRSLLAVRAMPGSVLRIVETGIVSASQALTVWKQNGQNEPKVLTILRARMEGAKASGAKKAMPKHDPDAPKRSSRPSGRPSSGGRSQSASAESSSSSNSIPRLKEILRSVDAERGEDGNVRVTVSEALWDEICILAGREFDEAEDEKDAVIIPIAEARRSAEEKAAANSAG